MKFKTLLKELAPLDVCGFQDVDVLNVHCDSRQIQKGDLFVAV